MSEGKGITKTYVASNAALDSTGDKLTVEAVKPFVIQRAGVIQDGGTDPGTSFVAAVDKNVLGGSRTELYTMSPDAAIGQGKGVYRDAADRNEIIPGEEAVVEVTTGGAAGSTGHVFLEVIEYPFSGVEELANMTDLT